MAAEQKPKGQVMLSLAIICAGACLGGFYYGFYLILAQAHESALMWPFVIGGVTAVAGIGFTFGAVLRRTDVAGEHILFDTWFPLFMVMVPVGGPFIALWSAIKLLRGRLGSATITTSSGGSRSTTRHEAKSLRGSGLPGGVILLVLASVQPLLAGTLSFPVEMADFLGIEARVNTWEGGDLSCGGTQVFLAEGLELSADKVHLGQACRLELVDCRVKLKRGIGLEGEARLTIRGGKLESEGSGIDARDKSVVELQDARLVAPRSIYAKNQSAVMVRGGMIHGKTALSVSGNAVITLRKVERLGGTSTSGLGRIHEMKDGELEEDIIRRARTKKLIAKSKAEHIKRYHKEACKGFINCYQKNGFKGEIRGEITMEVGPEGRVVKVLNRRLKTTSEAVKACIVHLSESKQIPDFAGPTGNLRCVYSGTVTPESRMVNIKSKFIPDRKASLHFEKVK